MHVLSVLVGTYAAKGKLALLFNVSMVVIIRNMYLPVLCQTSYMHPLCVAMPSTTSRCVCLCECLQAKPINIHEVFLCLVCFSSSILSTTDTFHKSLYIYLHIYSGLSPYFKVLDISRVRFSVWFTIFVSVFPASSAIFAVLSLKHRKCIYIGWISSQMNIK